MTTTNNNNNNEKNAAAFFASPFTHAATGVPPPPPHDMTLSLEEAGRWAPPLPPPGVARGQGVLGRVRGRTTGRITQRRVLVITLLLAVAFMVYHHDRGPWARVGHRPAAGAPGASPLPLDDSAVGAEEGFTGYGHIIGSTAPATKLPAGNQDPMPEPIPDDGAVPTAHQPPGQQLVQPGDLAFDASLDHLKTLDHTVPKPKDYSPFYGGESRREIDVASDPLPLSATLEERLQAWRNAPGGRGEIDGEVELGGFMLWNLEECGTIEHSHNTHMIQVGATVWPSFNRSSLHRERERLITHMEGLVGTAALERTGTGRGIVMQAGNSDTLKRAVWSIKFMRSRGATLPVQIYCFPEELPPVDDPIYETLEGLNAKLVAAEGQNKDQGQKKSYHLKAIAMIENPFAEVLYLDSDSIPTRDPEYMFDAPSYKRLGIYATPDYWKTTAGNPIWAIMGVKCRAEWEMETGQMFLDKRHHLDVLWLLRYMLEHHADDETEGHPGYFRYSDGDKDLFRWAMLMLRKRWGVPGRWVAGGALPGNTPTGFCSHTMVQHDAWGDPLFIHYNLLKQIPSGVGRNFCWGRSKHLPMFNTFPALPSTARLGEPVLRPDDADRRGLGDVDCDMLADADEYGVARAPAQEMIMRRAARERGVKVKYHGGVISALCIDFDYIDPRPAARQQSEKEYRATEDAAWRTMEEQWEADVAAAKERGDALPPRPDRSAGGTVVPDWQPPFEIVSWANDEHLRAFEGDLFDMGFVPNGKGF